MLERLAEVPWDELNAAYGPAEWVPEAIRDLLDPDEDTRSEALDRLEGGIFHQHTADEATPHVVPFLIELAASLETPDRARLLLLLALLIDTVGFDLASDQDAEGAEFDAVAFGETSAAYRAQWIACLSAAWDGVGDVDRLLDDPVPDVRIASGFVLALLAMQWSEVVPADAAPRIALRLRERLAREADPLARLGHAFALRRVAPRAPEARGWLRAIGNSADIGDLAGLASMLQLIDLEDPFDGPALERFVERVIRLDPVALDTGALVRMPWWSGPDISGHGGLFRDVEDYIGQRFERLWGSHPEILGMVERHAGSRRGIERANAFQLADSREGAREREWPSVAIGPDEDLSGVLALATVALRGDAQEVARWAIPHVVDAYRRPELELRLRASWFLDSLAATGLAPRVSEFAEAVRGERDPAVLLLLARALTPTHREAACLTMGLLQGWLEAADGPRDPAVRRALWRTMAALVRHAPIEETAAWLLDRIDEPVRAAACDPDRAEMVAVFRGLRTPERVSKPSLARWLRGDPDPMVRRAAVVPLRCNPATADQAPPLDAILAALRDDPDGGVRLAANEALASTLAEFEHDPALADAAVRTLIAALGDDPDWRVRAAAARNLGLVAPSTEEAQGVMYRRLMRHATLGQSGSVNAEVVEALVRAVGRDPRYAVVDAASRSLQNVSGAVAGLATLLRSASPRNRVGAATALAAVGKPALAILPELFAALADEPETTVRRQIAQTLSVLIPRADVGLWADPLMRAHRDEDSGVRYWIAWLLTHAGPVAAPFVPGLVENLASEHEPLRHRSLKVLGSIGRAAEAALPALLELSRFPSVADRMLALKAAWEVNGDRPPHFASLLDELGALLDHRERPIRVHAEELLRAIADATPSHPMKERLLDLLQTHQSGANQG